MVLSLSPIWEKDDNLYGWGDDSDEKSKGNSGCFIFLIILIILFF